MVSKLFSTPPPGSGDVVDTAYTFVANLAWPQVAALEPHSSQCEHLVNDAAFGTGIFCPLPDTSSAGQTGGMVSSS